MVFKISQNSQENTCVEVSFLIKKPEVFNFAKKTLQHRYFPMNFVGFLRTPFLQITLLVDFLLSLKREKNRLCLVFLGK